LPAAGSWFPFAPVDRRLLLDDVSGRFRTQGSISQISMVPVANWAGWHRARLPTRQGCPQPTIGRRRLTSKASGRDRCLLLQVGSDDLRRRGTRRRGPAADAQTTSLTQIVRTVATPDAIHQSKFAGSLAADAIPRPNLNAPLDHTGHGTTSTTGQKCTPSPRTMVVPSGAQSVSN
jgi:hypothetical protein